MDAMTDSASSAPAPSATTYRLDRRYVLTSVGVQLVAAGVAAMLAFFVWEWIGLLAVALLLNAVRLLVLPPTVVRADAEGARLGGPVALKPVRVRWSDVDDVGIERGQLVFTRTDGGSVVFSLLHLGSRSQDFVQDVYHRMNTAHGYTRYTPET
jgi:hypothetical protein